MSMLQMEAGGAYPGQVDFRNDPRVSGNQRSAWGSALRLPPQWDGIQQLAHNEEVGEWLTGCASRPVTTQMLQGQVVRFDYLRRELGPQIGAQETFEFKKSLIVLSHISGDTGFGLSLKWDGRRLMRDNLVAKIYPDKVIALIATPGDDGSFTVKGSLISRENNYRRGDVFAAHVPPGGSHVMPAHGHYSIERDCEFCIARNEPCLCCTNMRLRTGPPPPSLVSLAGNPLTALSFVFQCITGDTWLRTDSMMGPGLRCVLQTDPSEVFGRVQDIMAAGSKMQGRSAALAAMMAMEMMTDNELALSLLSSDDDHNSKESRGIVQADSKARGRGLKRRIVHEPVSDGEGHPQTGEPPSRTRRIVPAESANVEIVPKRDEPKGKSSVGKHMCEVCGSRFRFGYLLRTHIAEAHGARVKFECNDCGKLFTQSSHLHAHIATIHEATKKVICQECGAEFRWRTNLLRHLRTKHGHDGNQKCGKS